MFHTAHAKQYTVKLLAGLLFLLLAASGAGADSHEQPLEVMVFGDSLTAGYNIPREEAFPAELENWLKARGIEAEVINASVSGDTTTAGRDRLDWALAATQDGTPDLVILELGGNDMLRGVEPALARGNLDRMIASLKGRDIPVLLAGMMANPSYGREYAGEFNSIYPDLAAKHEIPLYPFFMEGVYGNPELMLGDEIHPSEAGVDELVRRVGPVVAGLLGKGGQAP